MSEHPLEPLGSICEINSDTLTEASDPTRRYRYIDLSSIKEQKADLSITPLPFAVLPSRARRRVAFNDVLLGTVRPNLKNFAIIDSEDEDLLCSTGFAVLRSKANASDPRFIFHAINSEIVARQLNALVTGSNYPAVNATQVGELLIPVPPLPEQKKIAEILSGIDKQILSVKSEIQQAQKIGTAVTKELMASIQDESLPLSEVAINHDSTRVPIKAEERALRKGPYRYYGASGVIDTIDDFLFDGDYILVGEDGANIIDRNKPLAFKVSGKFWVNNHAHIIQPRESCDINFLTYYLESLDYTGIASGSAQPKITRSALDAIQVPVPALEVQKKIGAMIESTIDMATTAEKKEKKLIDLKQALSADLLSGHKRVSV